MPSLIPLSQEARWRIPIVFAITILINYLDRNNLSLALPRLAQEFSWSDREVGSKGELLLAAFFLSYALSNMLLSPLAEHFGPKRSVMMAIAAFSLITILCAPLGYSFAALISLRLLLGLGEGVHIPMMSTIISRWFLPGERSRANAIWGSGILISTAIAPLMIIPLAQALGWRSMFAVLGISGLLLSIPLVYFLVQNQPPDEGQQNAITNTTYDDVRRTPPSRHRRDQRFWLAVVGGSLNAFCAFGLLNWLPIYFNRAKGINFEKLGWPLALVFATGIIGIALMGYLGDKLEQRAQLAGIGFLIAGIMVYFASTTNQLELVVLCFAIAVFCQSAYGAQEYAIIQRILPSDQVGTGTGLYNGLSILFGGVGGSLVPGSIVAATGSFNAGIFSIVVGAWMASVVLFVLARMIRY